MSKKLKIILRNTPIGRKETPWLEPYREKFAKAAKEIAAELKDTKLKGTDRIRAFNARMSQKLKEGR
jgi:lysophospholipase L1-like esterase